MVGQQASLGADYYKLAISKLITSHGLTGTPAITVFSDDPKWCSENLRIPALEYAPVGSAAQDLMELSRHDFLVLSGSTFSWWASQLQPRDAMTVVAPLPIAPSATPPLDVSGWLTIAR